MELLPLDEERRMRHVVYAAYFVRFLTDPNLAPIARDAPPALENLAAALIAQGQERGQVPAATDPAVEAELLLAATDGLQTKILLGRHTAEQSLALLDHQLDRVFG